MVDNIQQGYSPKNVANDAQAVAFRQGKNALTWDGIWMMNEWAKVKSLDWGAAPMPTIGDQQAVWASSHNFTVTTQAQKDPNKLQASKVFISWISDQSIEWAKAGQIPARSLGPGEPGVPGPGGAEHRRPAARLRQVPAGGARASARSPRPPSSWRSTRPCWARSRPRPPWTSATSKANELLAANQKKYGG